MKSAQNRSELCEALISLKPFLQRAVFFSFFINFLALAPTVYMLEVYGRVVNSRNGMTLAMLTLLVLGAYVLMEICEWVRRQIGHEAALRFDATVGERIFDSVFEANLKRIPGATSQAMNDLRTLREAISGTAIMALIDAPLSLIFLVALYLIDPIMGHVAVLGALLQTLLAWLTERNTQPPLAAANRAAISAQNYANGTLKNAQVIEAMGMLGNIHRRWMKRQSEFLALQAQASDKAGGYAALSKFVQLVFSSLILGIASWLTIEGELNSEMMIVAWILGGKAIGPVGQLIGQWKQVINGRDAFGRLDKLLAAIPAKPAGMPLPPPNGALTVENAMAAAPGSQTPIVRGVSFALKPGQALAVIGPSASGKSTLARLLVGVWPTTVGKVRLDGVDIFPWNKAELGPHIGYLPQGVELFDGTLAENIARFGDVDMDKVRAAAQAVGVHELIEGFPEGYDTRIGDEGCFLSGGQRQRVGLARAIYGNPRFVVLDEPNSSLDDAGEQALAKTLLALKAGGTTLIVITHRTSVLAAVDCLLVLRDGQVAAFGPRDEVLAALRRATQGGPQTPATTTPTAAAASAAA